MLELVPEVHRIETCLGENWIAGQGDFKTISVEGGHSYYVRTLAETRFFLIFGVGTDFPIEFIEEDRALPEIRETLYQSPEKKEIPVAFTYPKGLATRCAILAIPVPASASFSQEFDVPDSVEIIPTSDKYKLPGHDFAGHLVATDDSDQLVISYHEELKALEQEARGSERGLWADPHPVPPLGVAKKSK